jgi:hypothetical protein
MQDTASKEDKLIAAFWQINLSGSSTQHMTLVIVGRVQLDERLLKLS